MTKRRGDDSARAGVGTEPHRRHVGVSGRGRPGAEACKAPSREVLFERLGQDAVVESPWPSVVAQGAILRDAVRVLLVDGDDRLLLFQYMADDGERFWCPTGGGINPGESPEEAACREVREETGWSGRLELEEVWHRRHVAMFIGELVDQRERWFLARVPVFSVHCAGFTELERRTISQWRWWNAEELHGARERLVPADLASRLEVLLKHGPPARPFEIGS